MVTTVDICGQKIIKGKLQGAIATLWHNGLVVTAIAITPEEAPYQLNNMSQWRDLATHNLNNQVLRSAISAHLRGGEDRIEYSINGGTNRPKKGKGSFSNSFEYAFPMTDGYPKLVIHLECRAYAALYYERNLKGQPEKTKRGQRILQEIEKGLAPGTLAEPTTPWIDKRTGILYEPTEFGIMEYAPGEHSKFYQLHRDWENRVPEYTK